MSQILIMRAMNSNMLMWRPSAFLSGSYCPERSAFTRKPSSERSASLSHHINGGSEHQPPRPSYAASEYTTQVGSRFTKRLMGRCHAGCCGLSSSVSLSRLRSARGSGLMVIQLLFYQCCSFFLFPVGSLARWIAPLRACWSRSDR